MAIVVLFHLSGYRYFKWYYQRHVRAQMRDYFPAQVSYNRFVELTGCAVFPLLLYTQGFRRGRPTGISCIDSTPLSVCHNRRIASHNVFQTYAARGKTLLDGFTASNCILLSMTGARYSPFASLRATLTTTTWM